MRSLLRSAAATILATLALALAAYAQTPTYVLTFGGPGTGNGQLSYPMNLAVAPGGDVFVTDAGNCRVQRFDANGAYVSQFGSEGIGPGQFINPTGIALGASGDVLVTDQNRVQVFTTGGAYVRGWGTNGSANGQFRIASAVVVDADGFVYVCDRLNQRIQKFTSDGTWLASLGGPGTAVGPLSCDLGFAISPAGTLLEADAVSLDVVELTRTGELVRRWRGGITIPYGLGVGPDGEVFVTDKATQRASMFDPLGGPLASWGGYGMQATQFQSIGGIAAGSDGSLYVLDYWVGKVRKYVYTPYATPAATSTWGAVKARYR